MRWKPSGRACSRKRRMNVMTFPLTLTVIVLSLSPADSNACTGTMGIVAKACLRLTLLFGASEWWLGVDHPVEALEFAQATCEGLRFGKIGEISEEPQFAGREGVLQLLQEQPSEQPREDAHRQEEAGAASDPAGAVK